MGLGYAIETIEGESHLFEEVPADYFWSFWLNHVEQEVGACEVEPETGAEVLFVPRVSVRVVPRRSCRSALKRLPAPRSANRCR